MAQPFNHLMVLRSYRSFSKDINETVSKLFACILKQPGLVIFFESHELGRLLAFLLRFGSFRLQLPELLFQERVVHSQILYFILKLIYVSQVLHNLPFLGRVQSFLLNHRSHLCSARYQTVNRIPPRLPKHSKVLVLSCSLFILHDVLKLISWQNIEICP